MREMILEEKNFRIWYKKRTGSIKNASKAFKRQQVILKRKSRKENENSVSL